MPASPTFEPRPLRVRRRTYLPLVATTFLMLSGVASVIYALEHVRRALHHPELMFATLMGGIAATILGLGGAALSMVVPRTRERTCVIAAEGGALTVDGAPLGAQVAGARVGEESKRGRWEVALFTGERHPALVAYVPTRSDADQLAAAATPRVTDAVLTFRFAVGATRAGGIASLLVIAGLVVALALSMTGKVAMPLALLAAAPGLALYLVPIRVSVGTDGIAIRWVGTASFLPFALIEDARIEGRALVLSLRDGRRERFLGAHRDDVSAMRALEALAARVAQHRASSASSSALLQARLARCKRADGDAWLAELRAISAGAYREIAISPEGLWSVIEDASSSEQARIAAAALLRGSLDAGGVARLRAIARGAASGSLRADLAWVAEADPLRSGEGDRGVPDVGLQPELAEDEDSLAHGSRDRSAR